ncbi:MAG: hypothetical protein E6Q40_11855 [Cupriavidus sp.]|nr:MAG: hypothetical protein E6Q40_11855 [Cupriavidus sp.]
MTASPPFLPASITPHNVISLDARRPGRRARHGVRPAADPLTRRQALCAVAALDALEEELLRASCFPDQGAHLSAAVLAAQASHDRLSEAYPTLSVMDPIEMLHVVEATRLPRVNGIAEPAVSMRASDLGLGDKMVFEHLGRHLPQKAKWHSKAFALLLATVHCLMLAANIYG